MEEQRTCSGSLTESWVESSAFYVDKQLRGTFVKTADIWLVEELVILWFLEWVSLIFPFRRRPEKSDRTHEDTRLRSVHFPNHWKAYHRLLRVERPSLAAPRSSVLC